MGTISLSSAPTTTFFTDNTRYDLNPLTIDNHIGSDRICTELSVEEYARKESGELVVVLDLTSINPDQQAKMQKMAEEYKKQLEGVSEIKDSKQYITNIEIKGNKQYITIEQDNINNNEAAFIVPGQFDEKGNPTQKGYGISISWPKKPIVKPSNINKGDLRDSEIF